MLLVYAGKEISLVLGKTRLKRVELREQLGIMGRAAPLGLAMAYLVQLYVHLSRVCLNARIHLLDGVKRLPLAIFEKVIVGVSDRDGSLRHGGDARRETRL